MSHATHHNRVLSIVPLTMLSAWIAINAPIDIFLEVINARAGAEKQFSLFSSIQLKRPKWEKVKWRFNCRCILVRESDKTWRCPLTIVVNLIYWLAQTVILIFLGLLALGNVASVFADEDVSTLAPTSAPTGEESTVSTSAPTGEVSTATTSAGSEQTSTPSAGASEVPEVCLYQSQTWGVPNVGKFNFCVDGKPKLTECNENSYYVRNETLNGCVPAAKMDPNCVNLDVNVGDCTGINLKQPQPSDTLTNFYLCTAENQDPVELTCLDDKAFLKEKGYLGCFDWTFWRELRECQTYNNVAI